MIKKSLYRYRTINRWLLGSWIGVIFGGCGVNQKFTVVKKILLSMVALVSAVPLWAQGVVSDSILLSKEKRGDKVIERYLVRGAQCDQTTFELMFPINISQLQSSFATNADTIAGLDLFFDQSADTTTHIKSIKVTGYASPDGLEAKNSTLAAARAKATADFLKSRYKVANVTTDSKVFSWADCAQAVADLSVPDKQSVLTILNSKSHTEMQKQQALEHQKAWMMFKNTILPPMRHSVVHIIYSIDKIVEKVTVVPAPKPQPTVEPKPTPAPTATTTTPAPTKAVTQKKQTPEQKVYPVGVVETEEMGIIVEVPPKEKHYKRKK